MGFINERCEDGKWHTIDRDRNVSLKRIGSHPEYGETFQLGYKDKIIKFTTKPGSMKIYGTPKLGERTIHDMNWFIYELFIPSELQEKIDEVRAIIKDALEVRGWECQEDRTHSVSVEFNPKYL